MSYILEALRKADAERERGSVPNLHAQLIPLTAGRMDDAVARTPIGWWLGIGGTVLLFGVLAWWWLAAVGGVGGAVAPTPMAPAAATADSAATAPNRAQSVEPAASAPAAITSTPAAVVASTVATPMAASAPPPTAVAPEPKAVPRPRPRPTTTASTPPPVKAANVAGAPATLERSASPAAASARPTPVAEARIPPLTELPEDVRRQVPAMTMGGSVYSPEPERRMIIVNGQVFVEGNTLAPELKLETINPKSAVFSIRGQRFQVPL